MRKRLTKQVLERMQRGDLVFCEATPGFFAEAGAKGVMLRAKADLRIAGKPHTRKTTFGTWPALDLSEARSQALAWLSGIKAGRDPSAPQVAPGGGWTVAEAYAEHARGAVKRRGPGAQRNCDLMKERLDRYAPEWAARPLASISPVEARAKHDAIMAKVKAAARIPGADGARSANQVLRDLRAVWGRAAKVWRDLPECPVDAVEWAREKNEHQIVEWSDLPDWKKKVDDLKNPLRACMHRFALFSGLRPGNVVGLRRDWIDLPGNVIKFPGSAMKGGRPFDMPISPAIAKLLKEALVKSEAWFPGSEWLFPTRDVKGNVVATRVWKERTVPNGTGHALRHTYSAAVVLAGCSEVRAPRHRDRRFHRIVIARSTAS